MAWEREEPRRKPVKSILKSTILERKRTTEDERAAGRDQFSFCFYILSFSFSSSPLLALHTVILIYLCAEYTVGRCLVLAFCISMETGVWQNTTVRILHFLYS